MERVDLILGHNVENTGSMSRLPILQPLQPGHGVFACLLIAPEGLGSESLWKWWARGSGFPDENFSPFHPLSPPEKAQFQSCLAWPPLVVLLLSILAPKWAALTLILCTQHCVPVSHLFSKKGKNKRKKVPLAKGQKKQDFFGEQFPGHYSPTSVHVKCQSW